MGGRVNELILIEERLLVALDFVQMAKMAPIGIRRRYLDMARILTNQALRRIDTEKSK